MNKLLKAFVYTSWLWLFLLLLLFLSHTDPVSAGPGGILVSFTIIYAMIASFLFTVLHLGVRIVSQQIVKRNKRVTIRAYQVGVRRAYYIASALAFGPVLLLALNSVRQLKITDILLVVILLTLVIFYLVKRD